mgnify:FL=1
MPRLLSSEYKGVVFMLKLIIGKKGSGKTKKLIDEVTAAAESSNGNVVCIEKGNTLTYNITHRVRLVDAEHYGISGFDAFYGFLCGICAGNYDVTHIYVDAILRICERDFDALAMFFEKVEALSKESSTQFTFTVSADESEIPASVFKIAEKI